MWNTIRRQRHGWRLWHHCPSTGSRPILGLSDLQISNCILRGMRFSAAEKNAYADNGLEVHFPAKHASAPRGMSERRFMAAFAAVYCVRY